MKNEVYMCVPFELLKGWTDFDEDSKQYLIISAIDPMKLGSFGLFVPDR